MANYCPDNWVVLKIKPGKDAEPFYKVLAGSNGGFLYPDRWRLNSGIRSVFYDGKDEDIIRFYGESGSVYVCRKQDYGLQMMTAGIYKDLCLQEEFEGQVQMMHEYTEWSELV